MVIRDADLGGGVGSLERTATGKPVFGNQLPQLGGGI